MKRRPRKLALNRETLRTLRPAALEAGPAGGTGSGASGCCSGPSCCCDPPQSDTFEILSGCASNCGW